MTANCPAKSIAAYQSLALELSEHPRHTRRLEIVKQCKRTRAHPWLSGDGSEDAARVESGNRFRCRLGLPALVKYGERAPDSVRLSLERFKALA